MDGPGYYAVVFNTVSGIVVNRLPLAEYPPTWLQEINDPGSWSIKTPIGMAGGLPKERLRSLVACGQFSIAVCWGTGKATDFICQAGPIWSWSVTSESPPVLQIGGTGAWGILDARVQLNPNWNGASLAASGGADTTYTDTLSGIAVQMVRDTIARGSLPVALPSAATGTDTRTFYGYDLATVSQRMTELTQTEDGPDIYFRPQFTASNAIGWTMMVGNPTITQAGLPVYFDYGRNLSSVLPSGDGSKLRTTSYVVGNGMEYSTLWASSSDDTLINAGYPLLEVVDRSRNDAITQADLQGWANSDQDLYGRSVETWVGTARTDATPALGSYGPGMNLIYNMRGHCWIPDGTWSQRLLGLQNGQNVGEVQHILQATQGAA